MAKLVPIMALTLAATGEAGGPAERPGPAADPQPAALYAGRTAQDHAVALRPSHDLRSAAWRIAYDGRCGDGTRIRGRFSSGEGTPRVRLRPGGRFSLRRAEPTRFVDGSAATARFVLRGRLGPRGGSGAWSVEVERGVAAGLECRTGQVRWRVRPR